jgi:hypothetical protein
MDRQNKYPSSAKPSKRKHLDQLLDAALVETFPASDPVSIDMRQPENNPRRPPRQSRKTKARPQQK